MHTQQKYRTSRNVSPCRSIPLIHRPLRHFSARPRGVRNVRQISKGNKGRNVAHRDEASLHPKCEHFAPAQQDGMEGDGVQFSTPNARRCPEQQIRGASPFTHKAGLMRKESLVTD